MIVADKKIAVVTGAASGIGFATGKRLLAEGWRVALLDQDAAALDKAAESLAAPPECVSCHVLDIVNEIAVVSALDEIARDGSIRGLVNCAGIVASVLFDETTVELFRRMLDVNIIGSFIIARATVSHMRKTGGGSIVNVSSVAGMRGVMGRTAYGASKGGVITMTKVWATELAAGGIRVNAVAPGPVETPMTRAAHSSAAREALLENVPMRRYAMPGEIAAAIAFLLSEDASYITGHILAVDGGYAGAGTVWAQQP